MKLITNSLLLFVLELFVCCSRTDSPLQTELPPFAETIWVAKTFMGGIQCDSSVCYTPPDVSQIFNNAYIPIYGTYIEHLGVIAMCGAPTYAANHYALIIKEQLGCAQQLGFEPKDPPESGYCKIGY